MKDKATSLMKIIINYYIDLGKKDCSIAIEIQVYCFLIINFTYIKNIELTIKQKWTVHFFNIQYFYYVLLFVKLLCCFYSYLKPQFNRFFAVYFKYFLPNSLPANILKFSQAFKFLAFNYIQKCWLN